MPSDMQDVNLEPLSAETVRTRLLATVSHEMRTPLNGILGMTHLLARTDLSPEQRNYLDSIMQAGEALQQLIADLLDYSTIETGHFELHSQCVSPRRLVEGVAEMLAPRAHAKGIEIAATAGVDVPEELYVDVARLRQVLFNVIGNAVKFTSEGGVLVTTVMQGDDLVIRIRDSGPGMTEAERARLFVEFSQAGDPMQRCGGTGLGLFISQRLMLALGGSLAIAESHKGKGSLFEIRLPHSVLSSNGQVSGKENAVLVNGAGGVGRGQRLNTSHVLLFAPCGFSAESMRETIRTLGGTCEEAHNQKEFTDAFAKAERSGRFFTDVIVDHRLVCDYDGALAALVQSKGKIRRIYLVTPEERPMTPLTGFDAWLIRPLREQTLSDVLRGLMSGVDAHDSVEVALKSSDQPVMPLGISAGQGPEGETKDGDKAGLEILLGEDDFVNSTLLKAVLGKAGHKVNHVNDFDGLRREVAAEAGERAELIITDLGMPGGEGPSVLRYIRMVEQLKRRKRRPIIVITGDLRDSVRLDALASGADLVLQKPVNPERLISEIRSLLDNRNRRRYG